MRRFLALLFFAGVAGSAVSMEFGKAAGFEMRSDQRGSLLIDPADAVSPRWRTAARSVRNSIYQGF